MTNAKSSVPPPVNEPVLQYRPGSPERTELQATIESLKATQIEIPAVVGGKHILTGDTHDVTSPHEHARKLGEVHMVGQAEIDGAIQAAIAVRPDWMHMDWQDRAAIFLRASELLAGPWRAGARIGSLDLVVGY